MLFVMRILESIGLKVKKPMILEVDNKGAKDLAHNWTVGGRTRHVDVKYHFLRELKEGNIILVKWISQADNSSDLFTKNLAATSFEKHTKIYCSDEVLEDVVSNGFQGEGVTDRQASQANHEVIMTHGNDEKSKMTNGIDIMTHGSDEKSQMTNGIKNMTRGNEMK